MSTEHKPELNDRLETYFSILHSSPLGARLKRKLESWHVYAAMGGSAMAMVTGASATVIGSGVRVMPEAIASVRAARQLGSSRIPLLKEVRLAMAREDAAQQFRQVSEAVSPAAQSKAPAITKGGVVPIYGTRGVTQPGEWASIYGQNLAGGTASWNGDFPNSFNGTRVTINGKAAYLCYVSPTQINFQAPD